jgi:hypothetical protein
MKNKSIQKVNRNHPAFNKNAEPFFSIVMEGLKGEVDGDCLSFGTEDKKKSKDLQRITQGSTADNEK